MKNYPDFVVHILELMRPLQGVSAKRMFGGYGLFKEGKMFALVDNDELYLKVTDDTRPVFEARNGKPFTYQRKNKTIALSFHQAPAECLDDSRSMVEWAEGSFSCL